MQKTFVEGLSNEARFLAALKDIEHRGAPEANWMLIEGDPGYGKSKMLERHALRNRDARIAMVRAKAGWTPKWALTDIADALNVQRAHTAQGLEDAIIADLMEKQSRKGFCLIVDEIDHAARNVKVLETLRDLTDTAECILIASGMKGVSKRLKAYGQIHSRIDQFVEWHPATVKDVRLMCDALSEVKIADDLAEEIQRRSQGRLRLVMGAIARVEAWGRRNRPGKDGVTLAMWRAAHVPLINDDRAPLALAKKDD
jgi:hypothetical protein